MTVTLTGGGNEPREITCSAVALTGPDNAVVLVDGKRLVTWSDRMMAWFAGWTADNEPIVFDRIEVTE